MFDEEKFQLESNTFSQLVSIPDIQNPWQALSYSALGAVLEEHANGFCNTKHVMPFSHEVFQVKEDFQVGDVFQRALILDTLLDFNAGLQNQLVDIITSEADYLLEARRKTGVGGWAYFPGLTELPPDTDDLAQVMQVMLRAGYHEKASPFFEIPLSVLLNDQSNNDDGWESWIVPKQDQNEEQQLQTVWINKAWGTGSDVEVVANLVFALIMYDRKRFATEIDRGVNFLLNSHKNKHFWKSTWYYGNYYGTYVCMRAICAANGPRDTIEKTIVFLENSRQPDGSWEVEGQGSSALQTALALLALSVAKQQLGSKLAERWLESSLLYLQDTCENGTWPSSPFIQMPMGRPHGYVHTILTYESPAITNNYVAKASNQIYQNHLHQD